MAARSPALPAPDLPARLAEGVPAVVVLAGADRWFREEGARLVIRAVLPDGDPGAALIRLDARRAEDETGVGAVLDEMRSVSLFGGCKVVLVENADAAGGPWSRKGVHPVEAMATGALAGGGGGGAVLVLSTPKGTRGGGAVPAAALVRGGALVVDCRALYDAPASWTRGARPWDHELARFLAARMARQHGKELGVADAHALTQLVGTDMGELDAALSTLALYAGERSRVSADDVHAALGRTRNDPAWRLVEAVADGDAVRALELLESAFERGVPDARGATIGTAEALFVYLGASLHGAWRRLLAGAEALARGEEGPEIARAEGIPSFRAQAWLRQCARDPRDLLRRNEAFFEAEWGVKSGRIPARTALERLVIALLAPAG